jgi:large subunit ribosomal protein L5e
LVARITSHYTIAQVVYTEIDGDKVLASAYSSELPRYGLKVGLKNYSAAYCTGLLVARRALVKLNLADQYEGEAEPDGTYKTTTAENDGGKTRTYFVGELAEDRKPFRCVLDVGIHNTTTGARVFGVLKGAVDGGLDIPHSEKRFPGYNRDTKEYDVDEMRNHIYGDHIADYMRELQEENPDYYEERFSKFVEEDVEADDLEDLYTSVHEAIRADPSPAPKTKYVSPAEFKKPAKLTVAERKAKLLEKKANRLAYLRNAAAGGDSDDE